MVTGGDVGALVRRASGGDQAAWDALVERYSSLLWSVARGYRLERADTADAVQVAWLRLVEHLPRLRDPERVGAWLATTVRRECLQIIAARRRSGAPLDGAALEAMPDDSDPVDARLLAHERNEALRRAFERLPTRCRMLLQVLMADPPPSYQQVSERLATPIGSIGPTRARCLDRLRDILGRQMAEEDADEDRVTPDAPPRKAPGTGGRMLDARPNRTEAGGFGR